jgi:hypothetical protein
MVHYLILKKGKNEKKWLTINLYQQLFEKNII